MLEKLAFQLARLATKAPRGGNFAVRNMPLLFPALRLYPVPSRYGPIYCDLTESACFPLVRHGEYPHITADEPALNELPMRPESILLDIGANIGITVRMFAPRVGHVHAFEPSPRALQMLRANTKALTNVTIHTVAVADRSGHIRFHEHQNLDQSGISGGSGDLLVPVVTIDSLDLRPDFIKIDVEGAEELVLLGATKTLKRGPIIIFEALNDQARVACERVILEANPAYRFSAMGSGFNFIATPAKS